jgi:hypothetical protein
MDVETVGFLIGLIAGVLLLPTIGFLIIWGAKSKVRKVIGWVILTLGLLSILGRLLVYLTQ